MDSIYKIEIGDKVLSISEKPYFKDGIYSTQDNIYTCYEVSESIKFVGKAIARTVDDVIRYFEIKADEIWFFGALKFNALFKMA